MLVGPKDLKYYRQICRQLNKGACVCVFVCVWLLYTIGMESYALLKVMRFGSIMQF